MRACLLLIALVIALAIPAPEAQGRRDVRGLTCNQAQALVRSAGAAVLTTGRFTYDRYVASGRFCAFNEQTERAFVATRDDRTCQIGYVCRPRVPFETLFDSFRD